MRLKLRILYLLTHSLLKFQIKQFINLRRLIYLLCDLYV